MAPMFLRTKVGNLFESSKSLTFFFHIMDCCFHFSMYGLHQKVRNGFLIAKIQQIIHHDIVLVGSSWFTKEKLVFSEKNYICLLFANQEKTWGENHFQLPSRAFLNLRFKAFSRKFHDNSLSAINLKVA